MFTRNRLKVFYIKNSIHKRIQSILQKMTQTSIKLNIKQGTVVGTKSRLLNGNALYSFKGIPYGQPPVGDLRFAAPKPLRKFAQPTLDCSKERDVCYHKDMITLQTVGSEDCLFLNVFTPKINEKNDLPVMIWIHGGAFAAGSGNSDYYSPEYLVEQNVVIVTINYRLSILGFLCLPEAGIYGNAGLKDQRLAMEWVQQNISKFGGNPDNVTLFGESAGGACVHLHTLSKPSQKFFHKAICQSGSAHHEWSIQTDAEAKSKLLAQKLGCTETDSTKILQFLRNVKDLSTLNKHYMDTLNADELRRGLPIVFKPCVEVESDEAVITKSPLELASDVQTNPSIPIMMGYNSKEGLMMLPNAYKNERFKQLDQDLARMIPKSINVENTVKSDSNCTSIVNGMRKLYLNGEKLSDDKLDEFCDLLTDYHFAIGSYLAAELHAKYQKRFSIDKDLNLYKKLILMAMGQQNTDKFKGACHADEIYYLFRTDLFPINPKDFPASEQLLRDTCKTWTNFAKHTGSGAFKTSSIVWEPVDKIAKTSSVFNLKYLDIHNERTEMKVNPDGERIAFWQNVFNEFNNGLTKAKL